MIEIEVPIAAPVNVPVSPFPLHQSMVITPPTSAAEPTAKEQPPLRLPGNTNTPPPSDEPAPSPIPYDHPLKDISVPPLIVMLQSV